MVESRPMGGRGGAGTWGGGGGNDPNRNNNNWFGMGGGSNWDLQTIFSMKDVSEKTRAHLTRVYGTLLTGTGTCALGMYLNATFMIQGFLLMIGFMIGFAYCAMQVRNPNNSENA